MNPRAMSQGVSPRGSAEESDKQKLRADVQEADLRHRIPTGSRPMTAIRIDQRVQVYIRRLRSEAHDPYPGRSRLMPERAT